MYRIDQKLVCISNGNWLAYDKNGVPDYSLPPYGPRRHEIVTCDGYYPGGEYIYLREYRALDPNGERDSFCVLNFRPVNYSDDAKSEILFNFMPVRERQDVAPPVLEPA